MSDQLSLAPCHNNDQPESAEAARKVKAEDQLHLVLFCLYDHGPQTDDQIAERLGLLRNSAGTRRGKAVGFGWVVKVGRGVSAHGNAASVRGARHDQP